MDKSRQPAADFRKFKSVQPQVITVPRGEVVRMSTLVPCRQLPLVIEPAVPGVDLADWARDNAELIEEKLHRHGAILFRGFGVDTPPVFESFAAAVCRELFNENGEHPHISESGNVYRPVTYPRDQKLLAHNENSFNHRWPTRILFCCAQPPEQGGETPIFDSREVYARIDPEIRRKFEQHQVGYVRNYYGDGLGLSWQEVFQTRDRARVEEECRREGIRCEWRDGDRLRTLAVRPAVIRHPVTREPVWFNQAQHWHVSCLNPETRSSMQSLFSEEDLPRHCHWGDGMAIDDSVMRRILDVYDELEVSFRWQRGDVLLVDNVLTAHARNPFVGERRILVALGDMKTFDDVADGAGEVL